VSPNETPPGGFDPQGWTPPAGGFGRPGAWPAPKPKSRLPWILAIAIPAVLLVGGGVTVVAVARARSSGPGKESVDGKLPASKTEYQGSWVAPGMWLTIHGDGIVHYERLNGSGEKSSISGLPIDHFDGPDFEVGWLLFTTRFDVKEPPALEDGEWRMTVDGIQLFRTEGDANMTVQVRCKETAPNFVCTAKYTGGTHPFEACWDLDLVCENGSKSRVHDCKHLDVGAVVDRVFTPTELPNPPGCEPVRLDVENLVINEK
jgi:hypothetical protein